MEDCDKINDRKHKSSKIVRNYHIFIRTKILIPIGHHLTTLWLKI